MTVCLSVTLQVVEEVKDVVLRVYAKLTFDTVQTGTSVDSADEQSVSVSGEVKFAI